MTDSFVSYLRVSRAVQGASGLGLEAQRVAVNTYLCGRKVVAEFVEVETGKGANALARRPQLRSALDLAKAAKATLVIAKLDRLARNVAFISNLLESHVPFVAADMPTADRFQLHIYAALAERERDMISERTTAALAAAKARGVVLGRHGEVLAAKHKAEALDRLAPISSRLWAMRQAGLTTRAMIAELNAEGIASPGGGRWHAPNLSRALARLDQLPDSSPPPAT